MMIYDTSVGDSLIAIAGIISGGIALLGSLVSAILAVYNWIKALKKKNAQEIWNMVMSMADAAMKEAEASMKSGEEKKQMVIDTVKAGCKAAGIDLDDFLDQLSNYIDQTIKFVNEMK